MPSYNTAQYGGVSATKIMQQKAFVSGSTEGISRYCYNSHLKQKQL